MGRLNEVNKKIKKKFKNLSDDEIKLLGTISLEIEDKFASKQPKTYNVLNEVSSCEEVNNAES